ncbi:hypothetical protein [Pseudomonas pisciculturae]|uniref:hypothetical protein n=1 Tax=Pseudomonas pisciculturae TaxID=2730413 RepID=UPI001E483E2D|nr:hypothetical protein [Pseudomonas pisciculturae]
MIFANSISLTQLPIPPNYMRAHEQSQVRTMTAPMGRPADDQRTADRIIEESPVVRRFLESRDHYQVGDDLKMQVGDWSTANPNPIARANAAYDLSKVLRFIDNLDDRRLNGSHSRNGKIDGFYNDGYSIVEKSEASVLGAFSLKGYEVLRHQPT